MCLYVCLCALAPPSPALTLAPGPGILAALSIAVPAESYTLSSHCAVCAQTMVAGVPSPLPGQTICSSATLSFYLFVFDFLEDGATYDVVAFVNNTAGKSGDNSTTHVVTLPEAGKYPELQMKM